MKAYLYAIGDIHGNYGGLLELLKDFDFNSQQLVLIGDLNDRGPFSKKCLYLGKKLVETYQAVYLKGNHEDMLLQFLNDPETRYPNYLRNGGGETINDLLHPGATEEYSPTEMSLLIKTHHGELITFLEELPYFFEWHQFLFVHAGVDLSKKDWRQTSPRDFMWIREPFHLGRNDTGKTIVFGHTITPSLHGDNQTTDLWRKDHKIGIDGGGIYGGSLHGVIFNKEHLIQDIEIEPKVNPWQPDF